MPRRHDGLIEAIASFDNLLEAARLALRGKRNKPGPANFQTNLEKHLLRLRAELRAGNWQPKGYRTFAVNDPKPRMISAAPFADRVVHHALCRVIEPIFERGFIADSYANRKGLGTHRAAARYEHFRDRHAHVLRAGIYRYFPAIDHAVLKADLRRRIACTVQFCVRSRDRQVGGVWDCPRRSVFRRGNCRTAGGTGWSKPDHHQKYVVIGSGQIDHQGEDCTGRGDARGTPGHPEHAPVLL